MKKPYLSKVDKERRTMEWEAILVPMVMVSVILFIFAPLSLIALRALVILN